MVTVPIPFLGLGATTSTYGRAVRGRAAPPGWSSIRPDFATNHPSFTGFSRSAFLSRRLVDLGPSCHTQPDATSRCLSTWVCSPYGSAGTCQSPTTAFRVETFQQFVGRLSSAGWDRDCTSARRLVSPQPEEQPTA